MKPKNIVALFFLLPAIALAQFETNGKHKVKSVEWLTVVGNDTSAGRMDFSPSGSISLHVSGIGNEKRTKRFFYDSMQNLCQTITLFADGRSDTSTTVFEYDGKRPTNSCQTTWLKGKKTVNVVAYEYDTLENKVLKKYYTDGHLQKKIITSYDNAQLVVKKVFFRTDDSRRVDAKETPCKQMNVSQSIFYVYGTSQQLLQTIVYDYDMEGVASRTVNFFDKNGNLKKTAVYDPDDYPAVEMELKYDKNGNMVMKKMKHYTDDDPDWHVEKYLYKYDANGNWTSRTTVADGVPTITEQRSISYY